MQTPVLTLVRIGTARELTKLQPIGDFAEAGGLKTRVPM